MPENMEDLHGIFLLYADAAAKQTPWLQERHRSLRSKERSVLTESNGAEALGRRLLPKEKIHCL